jgi:2'-hydroxybiphenyl-2-sulfinate desulfinase
MSAKEFRYTICPVGNSSYLSANKDGFLHNSFKKAGVQPTLLQSLPEDQWHVHFDYQDDSLFREGGNIPPIWARSNGAGVILIGHTFLQSRSYILTRTDSAIDYVEQLRGKRLGIPVRPEVKVVDFYKATAIRGFETALAARGLTPAEAVFVELPQTEAQIAQKKDKSSNLGRIEVEALDNGKIDAIFSGSARAQNLLATGKYKTIFELTAHPDLLAPINNSYPNTLTVSRKLAEESPEIVVDYVKQALLAAEWAKTHLPEVLELFSHQIHGTIGEVTASLPVNFNKALSPELTREGLLALESQKRFLFDHGFIQKDFDIEQWADSSFLKAAQAEIEKENGQEELKKAV